MRLHFANLRSSGAAALFSPIGILALLSGLQRKGKHPRQPPGSTQLPWHAPLLAVRSDFAFSLLKSDDDKAHHLIVSCAFRCIQVRVTTHTVVFIAEPARSRAGARRPGAAASGL